MVPGNLEVWEQIVRQKSDSKVVRQWAKRANHWKDSDQLVEAMFAFSRQGSEEGPMKIFLMLFVTISLLDTRKKLEVFIWANAACLAYFEQRTHGRAATVAPLGRGTS